VNIVTNKCQVFSIKCDTPSKAYIWKCLMQLLFWCSHLLKIKNVRVAPLRIITYQQRLLAALREILSLHFIFVKVLRKLPQITRSLSKSDNQTLAGVYSKCYSLAQCPNCPCSKYKRKFQSLSFFIIIIFFIRLLDNTVRNNSFTATFLGEMCDDIWMSFKCDYQMVIQF
jgi:hypothetical protein